MSIHVYIRHEFDKLGTGIIIADIDEISGKIKVAKPVDLVFEEVSDADVSLGSTFFFGGNKGDQFLQGLVNALVASGIKPNDFKASDKEVAAIKYHLEDMRKLVFREGKNK